MTGKDLLAGLGYISTAYFEEAESAVIGAAPLSHRKPLRRPLLIAAIIALTLLLVGCAVVYALRLQDMSVGKETYTQRFDENGRYIEPVEKTKDILIFSGSNGYAFQQALLEWYDFLETYDPDGELMTNDPALPHIPDQYEYTYSCYTQDMVDKVDEIAEKYGLKLLDTWIPFQSYQSHIFLEETGIDSLLLPDSGAEIRNMAGMLYPPYNFHMEFTLVAESDSTGLIASVSYERMDYFPRSYMGSSLDLSTIDQWDYATRDGTNVLLALSNKGQGYIISEPENGILIIHIDGNRSNSRYPDESQIISKADLEAIADLFDYSMEPGEIDRSAIEARLQETQDAYKAEHTYVPEVYESFNDCLMDRIYRPYPTYQYTFYDLNGDGIDELILGYEGDGTVNQCFALENGGVIDKMFGGFYLCEGSVMESAYVSDAYYDYEEHIYLAPANNGAAFSEDWQADGKLLDGICRKQDQWYRITWENHQNTEMMISTEEAEAVIAKYPRMNLDWTPITEYPLDVDGYTLGDYLKEKDVRVSDAELLIIYKNFLANEADDFYTHYRILDINGDGVDDLLLSGNGEYFWSVLTYRYGTITTVLVSDFFLCENNILMEKSLDRQDSGVEVERLRFMRCNGFECETLDYVAYNKATASWQSDYYGTLMPEADAEAIITKYPRIDQGMQLISDLLN